MSQLSRVSWFEVWVVMGCHGVFRLKGHEGAGEPPGHPWRNVEGEEMGRKMRKCKYATYMPNMPHILHVLIIYCILCHLCIGISRPLLACDQRKSTVKIRWVFCDMSLHEQRSRCRWALCPMWGGAFLSFCWLLNGKSDRWCLCSTLNMLWYAYFWEYICGNTALLKWWWW